MFDNCKTCILYDEELTASYHEYDDWEFLEGTDADADTHFCRAFSDNHEIIPKDVWEHRRKCPYYIKPK